MQLFKKFCSLFKPIVILPEETKLKISLWFVSIKYIHPLGSFDDWLKKEKWEDENHFNDCGSHVSRPDVKERLKRLNIILSSVKKYPDNVNWRNSNNTVMDYWSWTSAINWACVLVTKNTHHWP